MFNNKELWIGIFFLAFDLFFLNVFIRGYHESYIICGLIICTYFTYRFIRNAIRHLK